MIIAILKGKLNFFFALQTCQNYFGSDFDRVPFDTDITSIMSKRKSSDTSCGDPVSGKATLFSCSYAGNGQSSSLFRRYCAREFCILLFLKILPLFLFPPSNCSGVFVTLTLEHAKEQNELTVTNAPWSLGIIISIDA